MTLANHTARPPPRQRTGGRASGWRAAALAVKLAAMKKSDVITFFDRLAEAIPIPKGELEYINPYTLLVAVVLSAQATDTGVNKATKRLFKIADSPEKMIALGEAGVKRHIKTIGLYNAKSKNVIALSRILLADHAGRVPAERAALEKLPGVGRKTANVVLNIAFGEPTIAVDTHIFRVGNRTGLAPGKTPLGVEMKLEKAVPPDRKLHAHQWLILHGRYVCKARKPDCPDCVVRDLCAYKAKTTLEAPAPRAGKARNGKKSKSAARAIAAKGGG
jgi:endonuclease-3